MIAAKWTHGIGYMAFGAFAAYLGIWTLQLNARWLPMLCTVILGLVGAAMLIRRGRTAATLARATAWKGRQETPWEESVSPKAPVREERSNDAALLGHEMKNYLCTLKGNARLLRQRMPGKDQIIIDRIDRVVAKLESFTRGMAEAHAVTATEALWQVRPGDAAQACVRTHFHKEADTFTWVKGNEATTLLCDPDRLEQVFLNLYSNALEAGARKVETSVSQEKGMLTIQIEDDGWGCDAVDLARIFEPYFTTKQGPARRGLGMFIVQSIVENHGGKVKVRTKNGSGGRTGLIFSLEFPHPSRVPSTPLGSGPLAMAGSLTGAVKLLPEASVH